MARQRRRRAVRTPINTCTRQVGTRGPHLKTTDYPPLLSDKSAEVDRPVESGEKTGPEVENTGGPTDRGWGPGPGK
eukprot:757987-Hanusia_phi.AAC.1